LDSLIKINQEIERMKLKKPTVENPRIKSLKLLAESHKLNALAEESKRFPKVALKLKSSYDYPNGPVLEQIQQNSMLISLSMPIWDGGAIASRRNAESAIAYSYEAKAHKIENELLRDWNKWSTELRYLKNIKEVAKKLRIEAEKVASINLKAYRAGQIKFTEVESANFKELEAEMNEVFVISKNFAALAHLHAISGWSL